MAGIQDKLPGNCIKPEVRTFSTGMKTIVPGTAFEKIWQLLQKGYDVHLTGTYGFAMSFYAWMKKRISEKAPVTCYQSSRAHRRKLHQYQSKLWIRVKDHSPDLKKAPDNVWIKAFYPDQDDFFIIFSDFLGMNGARQWYEKGIKYQVLGHPVHPFYGVYFPTRESHLHIFDQWLAQTDKFPRAADIGTGCGILSFIMHKHGVQKVHATDTNPNAIFSLREDIQRLGMSSGNYIFPEESGFLGSFAPEPDDLIVCNPPWIPETPIHPLDHGSYYGEDFFHSLFNDLKEKCPSATHIAIIFSNFAQVAGITDKHPVEEALSVHQNDFRLQLYDRKEVQDKPSGKRSWLQSVRDKERVELFVLQRR